MIARSTPFVVIALAATLAVAGCGKSEPAHEQAVADNVEMPAEESLTDLDPAATPVADASAPAAGSASASAAAAPSGTVPAEAASKPAAAAPTKPAN